MGKIIFILFFILGILGCGSQGPTANDVNGSSSTSKRWIKSQFPLKIYIPSEVSNEYKTAVEQSVSDWNTALNMTALVAIYDPAIENTQWDDYNNSTDDGFFGIYSILKSVWDKYKFSSSTIAITTSKYYPSSGEMVHADILFNENFKFFDYRSGYLCRASSHISDQKKCTENKSCQWQESETHGSCIQMHPIPSTTCDLVTSRSVCRQNFGCQWQSLSSECSVNYSKQTNTIDYRTALTHEFGHFLGLGHTDTSKCVDSKSENDCSMNESCVWDGISCVGDTLSIMGASITKGEVKQLTEGDVNRIKKLYK